MNEIENLLEDIERLRKKLQDLVAAKNFNLQDAEILAASQILNAAITKYNEVISKVTK